MRTVSYRLADLSNVTISLGFVGENEHTRVQFDAKKIFEQYPDAIPALTVRPPNGDAYPAVITLDGDLVIWDVSDSDLAYQGMGEIQLVFTEGETVAKSYIARTRISRSIVPTGEVPTPVQNWIDQANEVLEEVDEAIPTGGTTGQVLAKKSDADRDTEWVDQTGGGGGTSNYNDLSNKPQIGGVTLSGNKTLHDLGAAAEEDIPVVHNVPAGGSANQVLAKASGTDYDLKWVNQSGGGGGGAEIDDTAGEGDTDVVWSADKTWTENEALKEAITMLGGDSYSESVSFPNDTNIDNSGVEAASQYYVSTDYIELDGLSALCYTGYNGSTRAVHWYDDEKTHIGMSVYLNYDTVYDLNVLSTRPAGAAFVRVCANKGDSHPYSLTAYYGNHYNMLLLADIVGDGVTDDTEAFQRLVNCGDPSELDNTKTIKITSSIQVRLDSVKHLNGNGVKIVVDGDFYAFTVVGSLTSNASPNNIDSNVMNFESGAVIENFRITSSDGESGGGIEVKKAMKLTIKNNYIYKMENGIRIYGQSRDMTIMGNSIYGMMESGLFFDVESNLHQCNIIGNIISYTMNSIYFNEPDAIANFQITGNDIEIGTYPTGYANAKCINIVCGSGTQQFSEIQICGNTIQGHSASGNLMSFAGYSSSLTIHDVSITGNHISNVNGSAIHLENCENFSITGNNYKSAYTVYDMDETCGNILIIGDVGRDVSVGKIHAASTATLSNIKCKNTIFTTHDTNNIETSNVTNVDIDNDVPGSGVSF